MQVFVSVLAFLTSDVWLRLDHNVPLQQNVAPDCCNMSSLKSLDSLCSKILCEQFEILPEFPSIHLAEYLGTWESN